MTEIADLPLMPALVFAAELFVVTLGTIRIIFVARGFKLLAPLLGFAEVFIWLFAIGQIMRNLDDPLCFLAFAGGFALGNYVGLVINERLAIGTSAVQIITHKDAGELIRRLACEKFGVTSLEGQGATGPVRVIFTIVKRKEVERVTRLIEEFDPRAFYAIEEMETVNHGIFPMQKVRRRRVNLLRIALQALQAPFIAEQVPPPETPHQPAA